MSSFTTSLFKFIDWEESSIDMKFDLRRKSARRRVLIRKMEALGDCGVGIDSLESLKQTHARETAKLAGLTDVIAETLAGIHEKEGHVARLDLND
ncbi:hypothetical protein Tco_1369841 [Tanacetum coccineum]